MILIREALLRRFPIDELVTIEPIQAGPTSRAWQVVVRRGVDRACWFVKKHRTSPGPQLQFELDLTDALSRDATAMIPSVVPATDGSLSFTLGEDAYSVQVYIEADPPVDWMSPDLQPAQVVSGGAALSLFHRAASALTGRPPDLLGRANPSFLSCLEERFAAAQSLALTSLPAGDSVRASLQRSHGRLMDGLRDAMRQAAAPGKEAMLVHGDYHPGNVLWRGTQVVAIVDLEFARLEPLACDVAYGAYMFCNRWQDRAAGVSTGLDSNRFAAFVDAYNEQAFKCGQTSVGDELQAFIGLPPFLVANWLIEEYLSKPILRDPLGTLFQSVLKDALAPIECQPPRLYS